MCHVALLITRIRMVCQLAVVNSITANLFRLLDSAVIINQKPQICCHASWSEANELLSTGRVWRALRQRSIRQSQLFMIKRRKCVVRVLPLLSIFDLNLTRVFLVVCDDPNGHSASCVFYKVIQPLTVPSFLSVSYIYTQILYETRLIIRLSIPSVSFPRPLFRNYYLVSIWNNRFSSVLLLYLEKDRIGKEEKAKRLRRWNIRTSTNGSTGATSTSKKSPPTPSGPPQGWLRSNGEFYLFLHWAPEPLSCSKCQMIMKHGSFHFEHWR